MTRTRKIELDEFGMSPELNMPDYHYRAKATKDDRNPATKIARDVMRGAQKELGTPEFIRRAIRQAMPPGYATAMDLGDKANDTLKNLYHNSAREIKPALEELKRTTQRVLPMGRKYLNPKIAKKIDEWTRPTPGLNYRPTSPDEARDQGLQMQLGEIFRYNAETEARRETEGFVKDKLKEGIELSRHRDTLGQLDAIRQSVGQLSAYQNKIGSSYQRKSLELQFRQYFAAQDLLEETRRSNEVMREHLEAITKNTGLPDYVKIQGKERVGEMMRNKFLQSIEAGVFEGRQNFVKNLAENASKVVRGRVSDAVGQLRMGTGFVNGKLDQQQMDRDMGIDTPIGEDVGGHAADFVGGMLSKKLGKHAAKIPGLVRRGNRLQQTAENFPQMMGEWSRTNHDDVKGDWKRYLLGMGKDIVKQSLTGPDRRLNVDSLSNMQETIGYTRQANKSVTEIIPGFLARIHQELRIMRTGDAKTELTTYDYTKNTFSKQSEAAQNAFGSLFTNQVAVKNKDGKLAFNGSQADGTRSQIDGLLAQIDPQGTLTPEQRSDLGRQLLKGNLNNRYGSKENFLDPKNFSGKHAKQYADLFGKHLGDDSLGSKELELSRSYANLGRWMGDARTGVQHQMNAGLSGYLREAGLVSEDGQVDLERVADYYYGEQYQAKAQGGGAGNGGFPPPPGAAAASAPRSRPPKQPRQRGQGMAAGMSVDELLAAVRESNTKAIAEQQLLFLQSIDARLQDGVTTYVDASGQPVMSARRKGLNMSLKDAARGVAGGFGWLAGKANRVGNALVGGTMKGLKTGLNIGTFGAGTLLGKLQDGKDVYVPGERLPRMTAWKLKTGQYRDQATGRKIFMYKDIAGTVVDEKDNVVLAAEEVKTAFVKIGLANKALSALGAVAKIGGRLGNGLAGEVLRVPGRVFGLAKGLVVLSRRAIDVYTKDDLNTPKLAAIVMRGGGYFSKQTGKPVKFFGDIDGPVVDAEGNVCLTIDHIRTGLVDRNGVSLKSRMGKGLSILSSAALGGLKLAARAANYVAKEAFGLLGKAASIPGKLIGADGLILSGGRKMVDRLTEIRDLLRDRLPAGKRRVVGDRDGDGVREGSYEDQMARARAKAANVTAGVAKGKNTDMGMGGVAGLLAKLKGQKAEERDKDGNLLSDAADVADIADAARGRGGRGKAGRGWGSKLKGLGKFAAKGLGVAGAAYGTYSAYDNLKQGNYGEAALDGGLALGGLAMTGTGLAGMGGMLGSVGAGLGIAGTALLGVLGSPVVLGGLAVAALAGGAYLGYQALTRDRLSKLTAVRYAQYGFPESDTDHLPSVFGLERKLWDSIKWSNDKPELDQTKINPSGILEAFGVNTKEPQQVNRWNRWFAGRFKPVFLTHAAALRAVNPQFKLSDVDSLKGAERKRYFELSKFTEGPYEVSVSPFAGAQSLSAGPAEVQKATEAAQVEIDKDPQSKSGAAAAAPAAAATGLAAAGAAAAKGGAAGAVSGPGGVGDPVGIKVGGSMAAAYGADSSYIPTERKANDKIDALTTIRMKTYGLSELTLEKVQNLEQLERAVAAQLSYRGAGNVSWKGDVESLISQVGGGFGVPVANNNKGYAWKSWFKGRFLPVFLNYVCALKEATQQEDLGKAAKSLKDQDAVGVAVAVYTTPGVWSVAASPWPGYVLNDDSGSIEVNFQALKEAAKKVKLEEVKGVRDPRGTGADNGTGVTDGTAPQSGSLASRAWDGIKSVGSKIAAAGSYVASAAGAGLAAAGRAASGAAESVANLGRAALGGAVNAGKAVAAYTGKAVDAAGNAALALKEGMAAGMGSVELANFMGQQAHESGNFKILGEGLNYKSADRIRAVFGKNANFQKLSAEQVQGLVNNPEALANVVYGNRMGNTAPGDGYKYRGRGFIQLTGKSNYAQCGADIGVDLVNNPDLASDPATAAKIGLWYWQKRVRARGAAEDVAAATKAIQGGDAHLAERRTKVAEWTAKLASGMGLPAGAGAVAAPGPGAPAGVAVSAAAPAPGGGGGRGSINPMPVSEQMAGPVTTPAPVVPSAAVAAPEAPIPSAVSEASAGFQPLVNQRALDVKAQAQFQKDSAAAAMGVTLQDSLGVHKESLSVLKDQVKILQALLGAFQGGALSPASAPSAPAANSAQARGVRAMTPAPVSMSKV